MLPEAGSAPMIDIVAWTLLVLVAAQIAVHRRLVAALWLRWEDPRPLALLRIAIGALVLAWLVDLVPMLDYLFSSEGLVPGERAEQIWGRFGRVSVLYEHDSPTFVRWYALGLGGIAFAFTIGLFTPVTKWLTWLLFIGLIARNGVFLGGEQVFASLLFYLCLSRCGHAYGVDAWLRRRRAGSLAGTRPSIPGWPRMLIILQMVPMFCANGLAKYGREWKSGDTFHYVLNHPHFRPDVDPNLVHGISARLGTNVFRAMTWTTHAFELLFFLVVVGIVVRFVRARPELMPTGRTRWLARALGVAIGTTVCVLTTLRLTGAARGSMPYAISMAVGVAIAAGPLLVAIARRLPPFVLTWMLGRRLWVTLWVLFTAQLALVLEIGWFTAATSCAAVVMFDGEEIGRAIGWLRRRPDRGRTEVPGTFGPVRRRAVAVLSGFHVLAVLATVLPAEAPVSSWRKAVERPLWRWVYVTTFNQHWRMFAPGAPTRVHDIEVVLRDARGHSHWLAAGIVPPEQAASTWGLDEREKIRRRFGRRQAGRQGLWSWHAQWVCRRFGASVDGPTTVELYIVSTPIPSPNALRVLGVEDAMARARAERTRELVFESPCPPSP